MMKRQLLFLIILCLANIVLGQNSTTNYQYDALRRLTSVTYPNGTTITYTYDEVGNRTGKTVTGSMFTISAFPNPAHGGNVTGTQSYNFNDLALLTAIPLPGFAFVNWTEDTTVVSVSPSYSFPVTRNRTLVANFVQRHLVTVSTSPSSVGTASGGDMYNHGSSATVSAHTDPGFVFNYWEQDGRIVSRDSVYTFIVTEDVNLVACFTALHLVETRVNPDGSGTVDGDGYYQHDSIATLVATSNSGFAFQSWTDGVAGSVLEYDSTYSFPVLSDRSIVANFLHIYHVYTAVSPAMGGYVSGAGNYVEGSTARFVAMPHENYRFSHWAINDSVVSTDTVFSFVVDRSDTLTAYFILQHQVDVIASPIEGGTVFGNGLYDNGSYVHVSAIPNRGFVFSRWLEGNYPVSWSPADSFLVDVSRTFVGVFVRTYQVSASVNPVEGGSISGDSIYQEGSLVVLTATAAPHWTFDNWTDDNDSVVSTLPICYFTASADTHLTANFRYTPPSFVVNAYAQPAIAGDALGGGTYLLDSTVTMSAVAHRHYSFIHWTENDSIVSLDSAYVFQINRNRNLVAGFEYTPEVYTITAVPDPAEGGSVVGAGDYAFATTATLSAVANPDYTFVGWLDHGIVVDTHSVTTFTVTCNRDLVASFLYTPPVCNVTISVVPENSGWVADANGMPFAGGVFSPGDTIILLGVSNNCFHFQTWNIDDSVISYLPIISNVLTTDVNFVVHFVHDTIGSIGSIFGPENVCAHTEQMFTTDEVTNATKYRWTNIYGEHFNTTEPNVTMAFDSVASGLIMVSANNNCVSTDTVYLNVSVSPSFDSSIIDTASGAYEWEGENRTESGVYSVSYTTVDGCDSTITLHLTIVPIPIGINDIKGAMVTMYPNPTTGNTILDLTNTDFEAENMTVTIFDNLGRKVFSDRFSTSELVLDLTGYAAGEYFVHLFNRGEQVSVHKLVISK